VIKITDKHSYSFFGQKTRLIVSSPSKTEPFIFFRAIRKKADESWEKPSKGEGKTIKFNLEEIAMMLQVLEKKLNTWTTFHRFKDQKTQISFKWENGDTLWININNYPKQLKVDQCEILRLLLKHILKEKIEFATVSSFSKTNNGGSIPIQQEPEEIVEEIYINKQISQSTGNDDNKETARVSGAIKGETEKALLIIFGAGQEVWIPKSTIRSGYSSVNDRTQTFTIDSWVLKKNNII